MERGLFIQMFGPADFTVMGKSVTTKLSAKSLAILTFLICHEQHRATREKLASMLWSESFETATYNLRYNLWNIKKVIPPDENGEEFLITSKDFCAINPAYRYTSDLGCLSQLMQVPEHEAGLDTLLEMKQILNREFLEELYIRDSDEFNDWILFERTRYQKLFQQILEKLYESYMAGQELAGAEEMLHDLLRINPYEERYYCRMMQLCLQKGERHTAIRWYKSCEDLLRKDLNLAPSKGLRELYLSLTAQEQTRSAKPEPQRLLSFLLSPCEQGNTIPGAVLSDLIEQLLSVCDRAVVAKIPKIFLEDLASIQPAIVPAFGLEGTCRSVPPIRLFNSLRSVLLQLAPCYRVAVRVNQAGRADAFSLKALQYLDSTCPDVFQLRVDSAEQAV